MDAFEESGDWWIPDNPGAKISGNLEFDPSGGVSLELNGELPEDEDQSGTQPSDLRTVEIVLGDLGDGRIVTLRDGTRISHNYVIGHTESSSEEYRFQRVLMGRHFKEEPKFRALRLQIPRLEDWMNADVLRQVRQREELAELIQDDTDVQQAYLVTAPESLTAELDGYKINLQSSSRGTHRMHSAELETKGEIEVTSTERARSFDNLADIGTEVLQFVSLGMGGGVLPEEIRASPPNHGDFPIDVYLTLQNYESMPELGRADYLFRPFDTDFENCIIKWIEHRENHEIFHRHRDELLHGPESTPRLQFLSLVIALESYHERIFPDRQLMDSDEYARLKENVYSTLPDEAGATTRVENLLDSIGNQPSLKSQLMAVVQEYEETFDPLLEIESLVREVRDMRHNIAHGLEQVNQREILILVEKLRLIVDGILLREIGISSDRAIESLRAQYHHYLNSDTEPNTAE